MDDKTRLQIALAPQAMHALETLCNKYGIARSAVISMALKLMEEKEVKDEK